MIFCIFLQYLEWYCFLPLDFTAFKICAVRELLFIALSQANFLALVQLNTEYNQLIEQNDGSAS